MTDHKPRNQVLASLIESARGHVMTDAEREAQRQSFARGQVAMMGGERRAYCVPTIPIDPEADKLVDRVVAEQIARNGKRSERFYTRAECDALIAAERERWAVAIDRVIGVHVDHRSAVSATDLLFDLTEAVAEMRGKP